MTDTLLDNRYRLIELKGSGAFGEVWLARDEELDLDVAVKIYIVLDEHGIEEFKAEYKTAYTLNHPNLLHAYHFSVSERRPYLVMPFCPTSATSLIGQTDEQTIWQFICDVSGGLAYLHDRDIIHRDIKPDNVLRDIDGAFQITDFGISKKMRSTLRKNSVRQIDDTKDLGGGSPSYMAPELFSATPDAVKATDIWALGATLYEIVTGDLPFYGQGGGMLLHGAELPEINADVSQELKNLITSCLQKDPWDRPTAQQLYDYAKAHIEGEKASVLWNVPKKKKTPKKGPDPNKVIRRKKVLKVFLITLSALIFLFLLFLIFKNRIDAYNDLEEYNILVERCATIINNENADLSSLTDYDLSTDMKIIRGYEEKYKYKNKHYGDNYEALNSKLEKKLEELRSQEYLYRASGYMKIKEIKFGTAGYDGNVSSFYTSLKAANVKYLTPQISYDGLGNESRRIRLYVKIINPNGTVNDGPSSPNGFSFYDDVTVFPGENKYLTLSGWGNDYNGYYDPGTYRIELWYDGSMIYKQNFTLTGVKKATYLTVNSQTFLITHFEASGGSETYHISTDAQSWEVKGIPTWCLLEKKTSTSFTLRCFANFSHTYYSDHITVSADGQEVQIYISQMWL